jgi:methionine biosynthesis protein MetW
MSHEQLISPDTNAAGLLDRQVDAQRYDWEGVFDAEASGEVPGIIAGWLDRSSRVLDVGCGSGAITLMVSRATGARILGVEPDADRALAARAKGLSIINALLSPHILSEHGPFDAVMFTDVLEHLEAPGQMLDLAKQGLRPGGEILASVPNVAHWTVRVRLLFGKFDYTEMGIMDATHLRWFTRKSLRELFARHGFDVVEMDASIGDFLPEYHRGPMRLVPPRIRKLVLRTLVKAMPALFGCQHVIRAQLPA